MKKLLSFIFFILFTSSANGAIVDIPTAKLAVTNLYPYVVTKQRLQQNHSPILVWEKHIGHDIYSILIFEVDGQRQDVTAEDLQRLNLTVDQAYKQAIDNLAMLVRKQKITSSLFRLGPAGRPYIIIGRHWAAASTILLRGIRGMIDFPLGTKDFYLSIPNSEVLIAFANVNRDYRDTMRAMIKEKEGNNSMPLNFELFTFIDEKLKAYEEK